MTASSSDVLALYDEHAPRLYALALRITGDPGVAATVLEEVFTSRPLPMELAGLARATRDAALARYDRSAAPSVELSGMKPVSRTLVEEAFYRGWSVADLARMYSLSEETVRTMLREGMSELREAVAVRNR